MTTFLGTILSLIVIIAIISPISKVEATFANHCPYTHSEDIDPIVNFGAKSSHKHDLVSSSRITSTTSLQDLMSANCSACTVDGDKSAYWFPSMYLIHDNGSESRLKPRMVGAYYFFNQSAGELVNPIPNGLKMVVGKAMAKSPAENQNFTVVLKPFHDSANATFENLVKNTSYGFPESGEGVRMIRINMFTPPCMKSKDILDSEDHMSHVSNVDQKTRKCPADFPYRIPSINLHPVFFLPEAISWKSLKDIPLRLSTTPERGNLYQWHIDVFSAWEQDKLKSVMDQCASESFKCNHTVKMEQKDRGRCVQAVQALNNNTVETELTLDAGTPKIFN